MKRHLRDLIADSNDTKSSNMFKVDNICGITNKDNVHITDTNTEYRNEELDITFVEHKYKGYCIKGQKEEATCDNEQALPN